MRDFYGSRDRVLHRPRGKVRCAGGGHHRQRYEPVRLEPGQLRDQVRHVHPVRGVHPDRHHAVVAEAREDARRVVESVEREAVRVVEERVQRWSLFITRRSFVYFATWPLCVRR